MGNDADLWAAGPAGAAPNRQGREPATEGRCNVIYNAADDPAIEQPEAFLRALYTALGCSNR